MEITVKLHGRLRRLRPAGRGAEYEPFVLALAPGATVAMVMQTLDVPEAFVSAIAVNGEQAAPERTLSDGDTLHLFPPAAGG